MKKWTGTGRPGPMAARKASAAGSVPVRGLVAVCAGRAGTLIAGPHPDGARRAMQAMLAMRKLDIAALQRGLRRRMTPLVRVASGAPVRDPGRRGPPAQRLSAHHVLWHD